MAYDSLHRPEKSRGSQLAHNKSGFHMLPPSLGLSACPQALGPGLVLHIDLTPALLTPFPPYCYILTFSEIYRAALLRLSSHIQIQERSCPGGHGNTGTTTLYSLNSGMDQIVSCPVHGSGEGYSLGAGIYFQYLL